MKHTSISRGLGAAAAITAAAVLGACDNVLEVNNPAGVTQEFIQNSRSVPVLAGTVVSDFNRMYTDMAYAGAIFSDEAITGHNFFQWQEFDLRIVLEDNSVLDDIYEPVQLSRGTAELVLTRLAELLPNANADVRVAQSHAYAGYAHIVLAENYCSAPLQPGQAAASADSIFKVAIGHFQKAVAVATAATRDTTNVLSRADVRNLARLGMARAYLNLGDMPNAIAAAQQVPESFVAWIRHNQENAYQVNTYHGATTGANHNIGVAAPFRNLNDPRIRHRAAGRTGHNGRTVLFTPYVPRSFEGWRTGNTLADTTAWDQGTDTQFGSGLEARYIIAEAQGMNAANIEFVNARRAVGNQAALDAATLTADQYMAALRDQRRRDFYLAGYRMGDLRRYDKLYNLNQFPTGTHEDSRYGQYSTGKCYIPHIDERVGTAP